MTPPNPPPTPGSPAAPRSLDRVPTLTEVIAWPRVAQGAAPASPSDDSLPAETAPRPLPVATEPHPAPAVAAAPAPPAPVLRLADDAIIQGVLQQLQRQVELMLEYRLREVLTPLLARAADGVVRDARNELASTLRDVVARAVADELSRHRAR